MILDMFCDKQYMRCRDHRKLGQELDLFSIESESAGGGLVFWHPNGAAIRNILENFWKVSLGCTGIPFVPSISALCALPCAMAALQLVPLHPPSSPPLLLHVALHPFCFYSVVKLRDSNLSASLVARWTQCKSLTACCQQAHTYCSTNMLLSWLSN